jgi:hypothetical protein
MVFVLCIEVAWSHLGASIVLLLRVRVASLLVKLSCIMVQAISITGRVFLFLELGKLMLKWITFGCGSIKLRIPE